VQQLVGKADVFMHNFRPGVPERLGLGYDTLKTLNPRLVYGEASAFGSGGPDRSLPGHDGLGLARAGIMMACASSETGDPRSITGANRRPDGWNHARLRDPRRPPRS
jgi:crotonobetainyl-CoA:carnitine CoA-transferase CaiB-like acyl-CoA transferase